MSGKLGGAAFVLGAVVLWFSWESKETLKDRTFCIGGFLAGLGWLSHGGVAFGLLALAPLILWQLLAGKWKRWMLTALCFLILSAPWSAYQKWYEPPGNRLTKWHLAGNMGINDQGTLETIVASYDETPFDQIIDTRRSNLRMIYGGNWSQLFTFDFSNKIERQREEFLFTFYALGWWIIGFLALLLMRLVKGLRGKTAPRLLQQISLALGWAIGTLTVWLILMFMPGGTVIHQGSYTVMLVLFTGLALSLWLLHPALFFLVTLAQILSVLPVWLITDNNSSAMAIGSAITMCFAFIILLSTAWWVWRGER